MARPVLLWVDLCVAVEKEEPPPAFARYCDIHAVGTSELAGIADADIRPKVICLNYDFPDIAGLRLLIETKKRYMSVPLLMMTLQHSEELATWAFRARVFDFLVKPLSIPVVERCMKSLMDALKARTQQRARRAEVQAGTMPTESRYRSVDPIEAQLHPALAYISKHVSLPIPEATVASLCNMSPYRFSRAFKAAFGVTFQNYLIDYRISQAKNQLANPRISVIDVGLSVGFNDPSYFARIFKRRTGLSPSRYRDSVAALKLVASSPGGEVAQESDPDLPRLIIRGQ